MARTVEGIVQFTYYFFFDAILWLTFFKDISPHDKVTFSFPCKTAVSSEKAAVQRNLPYNLYQKNQVTSQDFHTSLIYKGLSLYFAVHETSLVFKKMGDRIAACGSVDHAFLIALFVTSKLQ
jgi:hypothetical protein